MLGWEWMFGRSSTATCAAFAAHSCQEFHSRHACCVYEDPYSSGFKLVIASTVNEVAEGQQINHSYTTKSIHQLGRDQREYYDHMISTLQDASDEHRLKHESLSKSVGDVGRNQERYHTSVERDTIIEWYSPLNFFLRQADIFSTRQPGTGIWLLEADSFEEWKSSTGGILWCQGMPGAGKTVLLSIVVDHLRTERDCDNIGVAAIYLNHKETDTHSPSKLVASIWRQLVFRKPIPSTLHKLYETHCEPRTRPSLDEDNVVLRSIISEYSKVFILVDALDEYPEHHRDVLLHHLSSLGPTVNLMLTSRPHITIHHVMPNSRLESVEIRATEDDVRKYLNGQIVKSFRLSNHIRNSPGLQDVIEEKIVQRSDGMFLLAKLHIDSLATKQTIKGVRDALRSMPNDLDHTYDEVVERINRQGDDDRKLAWLALSWITHAKRPLHPPELREALAVEPGTTQLDPENLLDMYTILSVCAGLVVMNKEDETVRLIHYTIQDYLESMLAKAFPHASSQITMTCITYLSFDSLDFIQNVRHLMTQDTFLDYAVEYCLIHARGDPEFQIRQSILSFLANCDMWYKLWSWNGKYDRRRRSAATLWIAAVFGLGEICRHLIKEKGIGTVLQEAALNGFADMVRILIKNGANVDEMDDIVELLVDNVDAAVGSQNSTTVRIHSAEEHNPAMKHTELVRLLVAHRADGNGKSNALQVASFVGHETIVGLLIEHGANTNARGGWLGSALQVASIAGHIAVTKLLIEHGADANAQGGWYESTSALQAASEQGHAAIAQLLIENGADVNAECGKYGSALQRASSAGHEGIVRLLIKHGANPDSENALEAAINEGHISIAMLLIENGADVNAGSALEAASSTGYETIVRLLIEHGADVNAKGGRSALQAAKAAGREAIVRLLIEHGADSSEVQDPLRRRPFNGIHIARPTREILQQRKVGGLSVTMFHTK
ncbi:ankyrin repeat-containing domain protein [Mycena maculata]|uniref:Ankyrin repeat-containing domain protein n=1 Tax=Mycena maculata TaxID=230809 RepID=A0AAD7NIF1_9AGAR|nr:ankyrin repeat-containing domain protein [Mycena maculata]